MRYHLFAFDDYDLAPAGDVYERSFDRLADVTRYITECEYHAGNCQVAIEQNGDLVFINYATQHEDVDAGVRIERTGWLWPDGRFEVVSEKKQTWQPIDAQEVLRNLGIQPGQTVTGYIPPGRWESDPL